MWSIQSAWCDAAAWSSAAGLAAFRTAAGAARLCLRLLQHRLIPYAGLALHMSWLRCTIGLCLYAISIKSLRWGLRML